MTDGLAGRSAPGLWWLSPQGAVLLVVPLTLGMAMAMGQREFFALARTSKSLTSDTAMLMASGAGTLILGALLAQALRRSPDTGKGCWPELGELERRRLRAVLTLFFRLTVFAYAAFLVVAVARGLRPGDLVAAVVSGDTSSNALRDLFAPVTGVTTLTQLGIAVVVIGGLLLLDQPDRSTVRRVVIVVVLALARAYLLNERLAFIELAVPLMAVLTFGARRASRSARSRVGLAVAPVALVPLLIVVFSVFEYSRSYTFFASRTQQSPLEFGLNRLAGYYATSYNNGALLLTHLPGDRVPYPTLEAVWTAPGVEQLGLYQALSRDDFVQELEYVLARFGSDEFNSPGGLAVPFLDYGTAGGYMLFLAAGLAVGAAYQRFKDGDLRFILVYPPLVTGLFELPRYLYWCQGRVAVPLVALVLAGRYAVRAANNPPTPEVAP